jgi:hypothetical protein
MKRMLHATGRPRIRQQRELRAPDTIPLHPTASRNPDLTPIARSKSTSQIHQHGQAESSLDQLSFEFLDPAAFERVREQGGLAGVARRVVRRQNTATGTTRG